MKTQVETTKKMNIALKNGHILIIESSLLTQSFKTSNNKIKVTAKRYGGGFGVGFTYYVVEKNGTVLTNINIPMYQKMKQDLFLIYKYTLLHI